MELSNMSVCHWIEDVDAHNCGYCKGENCSISNGMWGEQLLCSDYQNLIDRGWRRSGKYLYKPIMDQTCCPQYTIRCNALSVKLSKSQKKIIKRFNKFLHDGILKTENGDNHNRGDEGGECSMEMNYTSLLKEKPNFDATKVSDVLSTIKPVSSQSENITEPVTVPQSNNSNSTTIINQESTSNESLVRNKRQNEAKKIVKKGEGADPNKPPCLKAKKLRLERKLKKLESEGRELIQVDNSQGKTLEEFLTDIPENVKHKFKMTLVPTSRVDSSWQVTEAIEFALYKKYQTIVHNDEPRKVTLQSFLNFLVSSPLQPEPFNDGQGDNLGFGSYHQQYWLDDKLIAVGVIDILPKCVSSVYFFYDPDYRALTLGTYGSLREIEFAQSLNKRRASIQYYYMGFYIHSCPKMRYKGKMSPSDLLCPESYRWVNLEECIKKLDVKSYSRLFNDASAQDNDACNSKTELDKMRILINMRFARFSHYHANSNEAKQIRLMGKLIGRKCIPTMLLISDL